MNEDNVDFSIDFCFTSSFNKWYLTMIITDEASLFLILVRVPHWILFSLGIHYSVFFLPFSNFHIILSIKIIFGDIWCSVCLVFQFGSFLHNSKRNSVMLLNVHCCPYFCQSLGRVFDGPLPQITQDIGSKCCLCWFTSCSMQRLQHANPLSGNDSPVFCCLGFGSWAFPEAAKSVQGAVP